MVYLALLWIVIVLAVTSPAYRRTLAGQARHSRMIATAFWVFRVVIWTAIQAPLVLIMLGISPMRDVALYLTSLAFSLSEAAFILAQIVYAQVADAND